MLTMRRIILPQAMRVIVPPTGNETISMLKNTSLVVAVPYLDLTYAAEQISARTFQVVPMLIMACLWYLALSSMLMVGQYYIERYYARGSLRSLPLTPLQKARTRVLGHRGGGQ
jgi:polar amino acid transport system permease protein